MPSEFSRSARLSASWIVAAAGMAEPTFARDSEMTPTCWHCIGSIAESNYSGTFAISVSLGDWSITDAHASTVCFGGGFGFWSGFPDWHCGEEGPIHVPVIGGSSDEGDPCQEQVSSSLYITVGDFTFSGAQRSAFASQTVDDCMNVAGNWESLTFHQRVHDYFTGVEPPPPFCDPLGEELTTLFATAASSSGRAYALSRTGDDPMTISRTNGINFLWTLLSPQSPLVCDGTKVCPSEGPPTFLHVVVNKSLVTTVSSTGARQHSLRQGVVGFGTSGLTRLGMATNAAFDPVTGQNGIDFTISGQVTDTISLGASDDVVAIEFAEDRDAFYGFDGDLSRDGSVCWTDRLLFGAARDATVNDLNYNARADFNLDGVVDNDDLALLNLQCLTFDFDCNGFINGDDFDAYTAAFELGDMAADTDADGFVTGDDSDMFVDGFTGC